MLFQIDCTRKSEKLVETKSSAKLTCLDNRPSGLQVAERQEEAKARQDTEQTEKVLLDAKFRETRVEAAR